MFYQFTYTMFQIIMQITFFQDISRNILAKQIKLLQQLRFTIWSAFGVNMNKIWQ